MIGADRSVQFLDKMAERGNGSFFQELLSPLKALADSFQIFLRNKRIFLSIFAGATLPISLLLFSLSLTSHPLKSRIFHLEAVARAAPTRFEYRHVFEESRLDAVALLRLKAFFLLPVCLLSLIAAAATVNSTAIAVNGKRPTLRTAITAFKSSWARLLATSICAYAISTAYTFIPQTLAALLGSPTVRLPVLITGSVLEIYLIAVLSLAVVVSIAEDRTGWEAIRVGLGLVSGKKKSGWVLTGLVMLVSWSIVGTLETLMDVPDNMWVERSTLMMRTVGSGIGNKVGLIGLYGMMILFGYIINTVYYCDCRRKNVIKGGDDADDDDHFVNS